MRGLLFVCQSLARQPSSRNSQFLRKISGQFLKIPVLQRRGAETGSILDRATGQAVRDNPILGAERVDRLIRQMSAFSVAIGGKADIAFCTAYVCF